MSGVGTIIYGGPPEFPETVEKGELIEARWLIPSTGYYARVNGCQGNEWVHFKEGEVINVSCLAVFSPRHGIAWEIVELHDRVPEPQRLPRIPWYYRLFFWLPRSKPRAQLVDKWR
jgi:hypothetical protein